MTSLPRSEEISKFLGKASLAKQALNLSKMFERQFIKACADFKKAS